MNLLAAGGDRVEDSHILSEDAGLERLLGGPLPSPDALLDFLAQFHDPTCWQSRPPEKQAWVLPESSRLRSLDAINREWVARGAARTTTRATIDHDGTSIAAHKRDAKLAYEGTRGYQPLVAVWAEEIFETMTSKHLAIVSNRAKIEPGVLVRWHWEKEGTIEHVRRVMKDELGAGVMPSGRLGANAVGFRINALTFNVLTVLKRRALPERLRDALPKRLRFEWFSLPGKRTGHQGRLSLRTSARQERLQEVVEARGRLLAMQQMPRDG